MENIKMFQIDWLQELQNIERAESFKNPLIDIPSGFSDGWDIGQGAIVCRIADAKTISAMVKQRESFLKEFSADTTKYTLYNGDSEANTLVVTGEDIADSARKLWCDKSGKVRPPKYQGIPCNRRGYALPASQLVYSFFNDGATFELPIEVVDAETEEECFLIRMRENSNIGRSNYSKADLVGCAMQGVKFGHGETQIANELNLKRGTAQMVHGLATLCKKYAKLNLLARLRMEKPTNAKGKPIVKYIPDGWVNIAGFTGNANRTLLGKAGKTSKGASSIDDTARRAMGCKDKESTVGKVATQEQVERFIKLTIKGKINADAVMPKPKLEEFQSSTSGILSDIFGAILENSPVKMAATIEKIEKVLNK